MTAHRFLFAMSFAALLSFGCGGPETKTNNPCGANPCANPCADSNPCGGGANPCNPCAGNPCNPCGGGGGGVDAADQATLDQLLADKGNFASWPKQNEARFVSETHNNQNVDVHANADADGKLGSTLSAGAIALKLGYDGDTHKTTAVMVKREAGYDTDGGDWFYAMMDASGKVMLAGSSKNPQVNKACATCHRGAADTDFTFGVGDYE